MKDLAIIIRCHGELQINFHYGCTANDILTENVSFDYTGLVKTLYIVSLAKLAGVCYGSPDIKKYIKEINNLDNKLYEEEGVKNTEQLVNYLYGPRPKILPIQNLNKEIFDISYDPEITMMTGHTLNKIYRGDPRMKDLGFHYLKSNGLTGVEIEYVKNTLASMSGFLNDNDPRHFILKSDILTHLSRLGLDRLYLIDLSCYAYVNINPSSPPLNESAVNWLNEVMRSHNLKGGMKKRMRKSKQKRRNTKKSRKSRKSRKA